jgi:hypothetical protein
MYNSTSGTIDSYDDYDIQNGSYEYAIKVVLNDGTESPISKLISVKINR